MNIPALVAFKVISIKEDASQSAHQDFMQIVLMSLALRVILRFHTV